MAQYRDFKTPPAWARGGTTRHINRWISWMTDEAIVHDFLRQPEGTCGFCGGSVTRRAEGGHWQYCYHCKYARNALDILIPASYSLDSGLESLVRAYKDFEYGWTAEPLAAFLQQILDRHGECIMSEAGRDAICTWVPSDDQRRRFDHIERLINSVSISDGLSWRGDVVVRDRRVARPGPRRGQSYIAAEAYSVISDVRRRTVVLLDDLWTSGASMASTAVALKEAGAARVIGIVLGRQLQRESAYGEAGRIFSEVERRGWRLDTCVLCG